MSLLGGNSEALSDARFAIERAADSWSNIEQIHGLPKALYVAGNSLPSLPIFLKSLETYVKDKEDLKVESEKQYATINQFAELCQQQAEYLGVIIDAVSTTSNLNTTIEKYQIAIEKCGGVAIENVMKDLLQHAINLATALPISDNDLNSALQAALDKFDDSRPSLRGDPAEDIIFKNYGNGNQFYLGAEGHQNHVSGGTQIRGNKHTIYLKD